MAVGSSIPRVDGVAKVTGAAKFTGDLAFPGLLEARVLRSPLPHAQIDAIDTGKAVALPGVIAVLTRDDLHDIDPYYGNCLRDRAVVATDRVRFVGEPVAVVAAESGFIAEEALALIEVRYRELPCVADMDAALAEGAPRIHEGPSGTGEFHDVAAVGESFGGNICHRESFTRGDPDKAFADADRIIDETYEFPMVYQYAMEPHSAVAQVTSEGIRLWSSSAHPFLVRSELAHMFGLPHAQVEVIVPFVGGAYGSKSYFKIEPLAVAIARKCGGRPVRVVQTVPESMLTTRRHSARVHLKTGFKRDGTLVSREARVWLDTGAYADNGPRVAKRVISRMLGHYKLEHCKIDVVAAYTNTVPAGSMRSIGGPQTIWALESHMDTLALACGIDPLKYRLRHLLERGEVLKPGATPVDADLRQGILAAVAPLTTGRRYCRGGFRFGGDAGIRGIGALARGWQCGSSRGHHRSRAGGTHGVGADCRAGTGAACSEDYGARRRYRGDAVRPLHRREPFHHGHGQRGESGSRRSPPPVAGSGRRSIAGGAERPGSARRRCDLWRENFCVCEYHQPLLRDARRGADGAWYHAAQRRPRQNLSVVLGDGHGRCGNRSR
jgi:CO/xanthine dehydrogenase Mo-binding subunit